MVSLAAGGTTINRARVLSAGRDSLSARLRAESILAAAAHAPGLPPAAILCVKRLRDPLPGSISLQSSARAPRRWTQAVGATLSDLTRRAVRPARDPIAGEPDAVLFDDHAQMLACLAADWCSGITAARWWWRALIGGAIDTRAILRAWRERPEHIAAAIEELARHGAAVRFVKRLASGHAQALLDELLATHQLAQLATTMATSLLRPTMRASHTPPAHPPLPDSDEHQAQAVDDACAPAVVVPRAPWSDVASDAADPTLTPHQELLLGVALTLRRRPVRARSAGFAAAVHAWRAARSGPVASHLHDAAVVAPGASDNITREPPPLVPFRKAMPGPHAPARQTPRPGHAPQAAVYAAREMSRPAAPAPRPPTIASRAVAPTSERVVRTELGGVFYLLNVAIALGCYGDFTAPMHRSLDVSIWDFVTLVGNELLADEAVDSDPLWPLLATLAGRDPGEPPDARARRRIRRLTPAVCARLTAALGPRDRQALGDLVCRHDARVLVTTVRLDVVFSLARLPLAIRMSGLDRDPGWIPAADHTVMFHFE